MRRLVLRFTAFVVVVVMALVVLANTMRNQVGGPHREYAADFSNVSGLRVGDDVRAAGVKVGRVGAIDLRGNDTARVRFTLSDRQGLFDTTTAVIRYQNLLGQRYLSLVRGATRGTRLPAGSVVPRERTSPGFDLTALLNGFEPLFRTLQPEQVNRLSESIIAVMQGQGGTVESLLTETAQLTDHLADKDAVLGRVLDNLTPVLQDLGAQDDRLDGTVTALETLMTRLAGERRTIGGSIDGVSRLAAVTADLAADARPALDRDTAALRRTAALYVDNVQAIMGAFATLPQTAGAFARPMSSGTWLDIYICTMALELGDQPLALGGGRRSAVCR